MLENQEALYIQRDINRSAIGVRPKQALFDWLSSVEQEDEPLKSEDIHDDPLYLVEEMSSAAEIEEWLEKNFEQIFLKELFAWHTMIENYPKNITFKMFQEWFEYKIYPGVIDLCENQIVENQGRTILMPFFM